MRLSVIIFMVFISICMVHTSLLEPVIENVVHIKASASGPNGSPGTWKKKTVWKPRWVKEWKSAKVMKPTYKKVWSPVIIQEWVPFPKPPPEWDNKSTPSNSGVSEPMPLWDPMPYPESQQPPPAGASSPPQFPPFPINHGGAGGLGPGHGGSEGQGSPGGPFSKGKPHCHYHGCSDSPSLTFTQKQISQIIGHNRYKKETDYSENEKFPEPTSDVQSHRSDSEIWRSRRQSSLAFNLLQGLSQFLVPPKFPGFNYQTKPTEPPQPPKRPITYNQPAHSPNHVHHNGFRHAPSTPSQNKPKPPFPPPPNHHKPMEQPHNHKKINSQFKNAVSNHNALPERKQPNHQNHPINNNTKSKNTSNLIQPAELVSEYHYSEYDVTRPLRPTQFAEELKFKPLPPSMWSPSPVTDSKPHQNSPQEQVAATEGKPRPIRKDPERLHNQVPGSNQPPSTVPPIRIPTSPTFEQEKAITKEIIPNFNITPNPNPVNHRFEPNTDNKYPEKENFTNTIDNGLEPTIYETQKTDSNLLTKKPIRLSEEALLNALQKNRTIQRSTTPCYLPKTSSSPDDLEAMSTITTPKSPVYIVTPIYQSQTN